MIKKTIQSFTFFAFIQVFIFSCCNDTFNVYYESVEFIAEDTLDFDNTTVASEDLVLNLSPMYEFVMASNLTEFKQFSNSAYATSCDSEYIYKETISDLQITANVDILGITAGNPLNEKLSFVNPQTGEHEVFENILNSLNRQNGYGRYDSLDIVLNENIAADTTLFFNIQVNIIENDRTLETSTETITIE